MVPDLKRRLPGRGIWITATRQALRPRSGARRFARGFKRDVRVASDLVRDDGATVGTRRARRAWRCAHKAGKVAIGFANVETALARAPDRGTSPCCRSRAPMACESSRPRAPARGYRGNRGHRCIYLGAIGFGIGAVKCGTCSPARWSGKRDVSRAQRALLSVSGRVPCRKAPSRQVGRSTTQECETGRKP